MQPAGQGCPRATQAGGGGGGGGGGGNWMTPPWQVPFVHTPKQHWSVVPHTSPSWLQHLPFFADSWVTLPQHFLHENFSEGVPFFDLRLHVLPGGKHVRC